MDSLKLSDVEQRLYGELFSICDVENTGKITGIRATELFLSSGLSQDILHQITDQCGAKRLGHFGRSQFYIALKLIAAVQFGLPPTLESFNSGIEIPLPKFSQHTEGGYIRSSGDQDQHHISRIGALGGMQQLQSGQFIQPQSAPRHHARGMTAPAQIMRHADTGPQAQIQNNNKDIDDPHKSKSPPMTATESPPGSPTVRPSIGNHSKPLSAPVIMTAKPTLNANTNNGDLEGPVKESSWASFEDDSQGLLTPAQKYWANFPEHAKNTDTSSISSAISSENESVDDVWSITDEQRDYYINQFKSMQPKLDAVISGAVAKDFFEKSKLPIQELSKIWQLSDVNKDGALSLQEFCTAMHLVVLRRNEIELPEHLPPALMPYGPLLNTDEPFAADLPPGGTLKRLTPTSPPPNLWPQSSTFQPVVLPPVTAESPTSSSVSSPGIKPVNFEFMPITADSDSMILHPVPLRMSPDSQPLPAESIDYQRNYSDPGPYDSQDPEVVLSPTKQRSYADMFDSQPDTQSHVHLSTPLQSRPRPTPKKSSSISGPCQEGPSQPLLLPPPLTAAGDDQDPNRPASLAVGGQSSDAEPPLPPPRKSGHSRSSSLDNNLILGPSDQGTQSQLGVPPPAVPPRPPPSQGGPRKPGEPVFGAVDTGHMGFADFTKFETIPSQEVLNVLGDSSSHVGHNSVLSTETHKRSVSLDYNQMTSGAFGKKQNSHLDTTDSTHMPVMTKRSSTPPSGYSRHNSRDDTTKDEIIKDRTSQLIARQSSVKDKRDLQAAIRRQKEHNTMLSRLNSELNQELQEVMEQRIALEIQLEHLRPFSS